MNITKELKRIAKLAGEEILKIYQSQNFNEQLKSDNTPLTQADLNAQKVIAKELFKLFPHIPILAEESEVIDYEIRKKWKECFIIDPLDGTKEFIKKNDQFTVNIAYCKDDRVVDGVVYAPVYDQLYYTESGKAYKESAGEVSLLPIKSSKRPYTIVISNSHLNSQTQKFLDDLKKRKTYELKRMGSSLKMCMIAEGSADFYPRLGPTSEWDTAASQAILEASGAKLLDWDTNQPLRYNKERILNPHFKVLRD